MDKKLYKNRLMDLDMTQTKLAAKLDTTNARLSAIANGRILPKLQESARIANILKVNTGDLFPEYQKMFDTYLVRLFPTASEK